MYVCIAVITPALVQLFTFWYAYIFNYDFNHVVIIVAMVFKKEVFEEPHSTRVRLQEGDNSISCRFEEETNKTSRL